MLAGPGDADTVRLMFNHAVRTSQYSFQYRALTIDTLPSRRYSDRHPATAQLLAVANAMRDAGEIDAILSTSDPADDIELKHFGHHLDRKRDFRGIPLLGWAIGVEQAPTDYVCHFDSDILMHADAGYSWITQAIQTLAHDPAIMFVAPKGGPPNGAISAPVVAKTFSSRRFVVDRRKLKAILPLPPAHSSWKRRLLMKFGGASSYWPWEYHVGQAMVASPYSNMWLGDERAWFIHSPDHGDRWRRSLEQLVHDCERGHFPAAQAGHGELQLEAWLDRVA